MSEALRAPFPWFGGKSAAAELIWSRLGDVPNYVEPFAGSLAVLLGRPHEAHTETVNDLDGMLANFWRAVAADPDAVAHAADWPVNENDLHARHAWLVSQRPDLVARLEGDPGFYDAQIAGWWAWGACAWIGSGWCSGNGPWGVEDGRLVKVGNAGKGVNRKIPHLGDAGKGVNRKIPHLGDAGKGVNRKIPHLGDAGKGEWFAALANRLRRVRVCCGDWSRVLTPSVTTKHGLTGVLLDPPYATEHTDDVYAHNDDATIAARVRAWALAHGDDPLLRIALCGYAGEHDALLAHGWTVGAWKGRGGYQDVQQQETVWFSPHCMGAELPLFAEVPE